MPNEKTPKFPVDISIQASTKDVAPVVNNFLEKISRFIGIGYEPNRRRRDARSIVDSVEILGEIDESSLSGIQLRAVNRILNEGVAEQENIEHIAAGAHEELKPDAKPEEIEDDWLSDFFQKARNISDQEMSGMWSRVLAGEANNPGAFSKRTVATLYEMSKFDAHLFSRIAQYTLSLHGHPFVFHNDPPKGCPTFLEMQHLDAIGLIQFNSLSGYTNKGRLGEIGLVFPNGTIVARKTTGGNESVQLNVGSILYTETGLQLNRIARAKPYNAMADYTKRQFEKQDYEVTYIPSTQH